MSGNTRDTHSVREGSDVAHEANMEGKQTHAGRILPIVVQRNSELPDGHPEKVYTCRIVHGGDQVKGESNAAAIFAALSSSPAGIEASKSVDAYGRLKGNGAQQSDGTQSYTQATLGSRPNSPRAWAKQPKELQPQSPAKYMGPIVTLRTALYGHPESRHWERHLEYIEGPMMRGCRHLAITILAP